jgi:hypothetical protein
MSESELDHRQQETYESLLKLKGQRLVYRSDDLVAGESVIDTPVGVKLTFQGLWDRGSRDWITADSKWRVISNNTGIVTAIDEL